MVIAIVLCCVAGQSFGQTLSGRALKPRSRPRNARDSLTMLWARSIHMTRTTARRWNPARNAVVGNTIDDLYFWSNVVTLLLLSGLVAIVLFQWRAMDKREVIAASLIAQLWNGRVSDRIEIERRTQQFNQLVEAHNADAEENLSRKPGPSEQDAETTGSLTQSVRNLADSKGISPAEAEKIAASAPDATAASLATKQSPAAAARGSVAEQRTESQAAPEPNDRLARPGAAPQRNSQGRIKGPE